MLDESVALQPIAETYSGLGVIHYYLGDFDKAVENLRRAVELTPSDSLIWLNFADSLHFAGRPDEATDAYERARSLSA